MSKNDRIKFQWNQASESWVDFVRNRKDYYRECMNGPALIRMMGDVKGKNVLDLGCGEGYYSRFFAELGAHVTGIDFSEDMVNAASEEELRSPLGINYLTADASNLKEIDSCCFDAVFSFMTLMDIQDYESAVKEVSRVLRERGRFIIVTVHPCFEWSDGQISGWETRVREDGSEISQYYLYDYFKKRIETVSWDFERLSKPFVTTSYHRTLSDYMSALITNGLFITCLEEPKPSEQGLRIYPSLERHTRIPHSIAIEAIKANLNAL